MEEIQDLAPEQMLSILEMESTFLDKLKSKIAEELHRLQVEEDIYMRAVGRIKAAQQAERDEMDRELQDAMSVEHQNGDVPQPSEDISEAEYEGSTPRRNRDPGASQFALTGNVPEGHEIVPIGR